MSDTPPSPLSSFILFPNLPFELRCLIWKTSCQSRLVEVSYDSGDGFTSNIAHPIALEICQESRNAVINKYPLSFGSIFHPAKIRFNFAIDILYIDNCIEEDVAHLFSTFREHEISSLRYLALDEYFGGLGNEQEFDPFEGLQRAVQSLAGLRQLIVVFHVDNLSTRITGCGGEHDLELFDELPEELENPAFEIPPLSSIPLHGFKDWELKAPCRAIYGWRRCPDNDDILLPTPPPFFDFFAGVEESDEEVDEWAAGWPQAFGMGMFHPDDLIPGSDSEMDDMQSEPDDSENRSEAASLD